MPTFHIEHFGCRATQPDAAASERQLLDSGYLPSAGPRDAGVIVVSTCTVTSSADQQARQAIRLLHRENPQARIAVTGCYAQRAPEEVASLDGVSWVVGNSHQTEIPRLLSSEAAPSLAASSPASAFFPVARLDGEPLSLAHGPTKILTGNIFEQSALSSLSGAPVLGDEDGHTRPILKIQDGCNHRCAYCVIPFVRGRSRSLPPEAVLLQINRLCASGVNEIVLSGINLGSYGLDLSPRVEFGDLLRRVLEETPLLRLRVSSIEPMDVTRDLVELFAATGRIAHHFHIPLQSGSDRILAAMHRWYRTAHYARRVELIRELLPNAGIGADIIAGFPAETETDHQATLALIRQLPLTYLHVFSFSKRPETRAAEMSGEVPPEVIKRRSRELHALAAERAAAFRAAQLGCTLRVLTLNRSSEGRFGEVSAVDGSTGHSTGAWTGALSSNYLDVRVAGSWPANRILDVRVTALNGSHLIGQALDAIRETRR